MSFTELGTKKESEMSPYEKRVQQIDTPILCVAEAEKMIRDIGLDLIADMEIPKRRSFNVFRSRTFLMSFRRLTVG
jgi:hypothetical protein